MARWIVAAVREISSVRQLDIFPEWTMIERHRGRIDAETISSQFILILFRWPCGAIETVTGFRSARTQAIRGNCRQR
jgi:hypothetical protein